MSSPVDVENFRNPIFNWGKKIGCSGEMKRVQFYGSFTYDEVDYNLYDCVYIYTQDKPDPYIGKLIEIWEDADKSKKVKVQWFFCPAEISYHLRDVKVAENELFFATGEGTAVANINPLEAIAGKCNVVCISTDCRNPQPSVDEVQRADYVFYRLFDVRNCLILDKMDDKVGGVDVEFVFNQKEDNTPDIPKHSSNNREGNRNIITCKEIVKIADPSTAEEISARVSDGNKFSVPSSAEQLKARDSDGNYDLMDKARDKSARKSGALDNPSLNSSKLDHPIKLSEDEDKNGFQIPNLLGKGSKTLMTSSLSSDAKPKPRHDKGTVRPREKAKLAGKLSVSEERPFKLDMFSSKEKKSERKTSIILSNAKLKPGHTIGHGKKVKLAENLSVSVERPLKSNVFRYKETSGGRQHSLRSRNDSELDGSSDLRERPSDTRADAHKMKLKSADDNSFRPQLAAKLVECSSASRRMTSGSNGFPSKERPLHEKNSIVPKRDPKFAANPCGLHERPLKKVKIDSFAMASVDMNNRVQELDKSAGIVASTSKKGRKVEGQIFEVTPRPRIDKSTWIKELAWEDRVQEAHDNGRLVLLQNLDPQYTSGEVEDIVWHAFNECCSAKMIQHTAVSNPHCGRALIIFKRKKSAEEVLHELDNGCLMLPNGRPLVGLHAVLPRVRKQTTFPGHLAIDDARRQMQRDTKDAVSSSHHSQANTIEFELAMEWCLLRARSDLWWKRLYEGQRAQLKRMGANLKSK